MHLMFFILDVNNFLRVPMYKQPDIETVHIFCFVALLLLLHMVVNPSQRLWV